MNSREYWQAREAAQLQHNLTEEAEYDRRLAKIYQDMLDACQKEIDSFYAKYASAEGITLAEAKKRVSKMDVAAYERKAARYVAEKNFSKRANDELRLYNATMQINRLELLKANIGLELLAGHAELESFMAEILQGRTMDELRRQAGILGERVKNNAKAARAIVNSSFHNAGFSDRIWMYQDILRNELSSLLQSGLIQGKGSAELARELRKRFNVKVSDAERLMITELRRVQTEAAKQSYERNGNEEYIFLALNPEVNSVICDECKKLDGQHFKVADMKPGENAPPMHPRCHCSTAPYVDRKEYEAWLDFLSKGGTTAEWEQWKKAAADRRDILTSVPVRSTIKIQGGFSAFPVGSVIGENVKNVVPKPGYFDVALHGSPRAVCFGTETLNMSPKTLANIIRHNAAYHGEPIRLLSCSTGKREGDDYCFAEELANALGVTVIAPNDTLFIYRSGRLEVGEFDVGKFESYKPNERRRMR